MKNKKWWQKTSIYQIYPRSFKDSDNDGIGDLKGILSKLDYIQEIGFETIWISPFFKSPLKDWGYDVSDYYSIAAEYGDMSDLEELIHQVQQRNMHILLDLVMNHTSEKHPWFQESRSSRENPKRDWYIWRYGRGRRPPNNWKSVIGSSGWNYDKKTDQWYYSSFLPFQPDLNYRNPAVKEAMLDVARFWFDKGVDGFRLDMFHTLFKDAKFRDNPWSTRLIPFDIMAGYFQEWRFNRNQPEAVQLAQDLRKMASSYSPEKLLLGEIFGNDSKIKEFLGQKLDGLNLVFLWDLMDLKANARFLRTIIQHYELLYPEPYTPVYVFGNHDRKRLFSRIGEDERLVTLLALFQLTVRGVPVIYYGEEIGMADVSIPAAQSKDPAGQRYKWVPDFFINWLDLYLNRDGCRTPMQWDDGLNAGFCDREITPWLPVHQNHDLVNVKYQLESPGSVLSVYRELLRLRNGNSVLQKGTLAMSELPGFEEQLLAYVRQKGTQKVLILINFGDSVCSFANSTNCNHLLFQTGRFESDDAGNVNIHPYSGLILST
jgi:oligo-1,6-glucosidase/alpha-glucosidase